MATHRTTGMTAVGILNIVFGALGSLTALLMIFVGSAASVVGSQLGEGHAPGATTAGGIAIITGLISLAAWALMLVSGVGVLKLAPWGRKLSIICGGVGGLLMAFQLFTTGFSFNLITYGSLIYCILLVALFMQPAWKAVFESGASHSGSESTSDKYRKAA